jgi:hypothetical protein
MAKPGVGLAVTSKSEPISDSTRRFHDDVVSKKRGPPKAIKAFCFFILLQTCPHVKSKHNLEEILARLVI